jgi:hypothetical protein
VTHTLAELTDRYDVEVLDHLDRQVTIPVLAGVPQAQGDLIVLHRPSAPTSATGHRTAVPPAGVPVVRGENGGHTHLLVADGPVTWAPAREGGQDLGYVTVPAGSTAYLIHPKHGGNGIGTGTYLLRRQREQQADETKLVAD